MTSGSESEQIQEQPEGEGRVPLYWELDWNRVLYVNSAIDDDFVRRVAPEILKLKQASPAPITVAIDSEGGYLSSLDSLHGLLTSPGQRGERWHILTVAMNRAQSAAATLLALGDYSFAYDHSRILFHPVRLDADELTAERAIYTASSLQRDDDRYASLLAEHNLIKIIWSFDELRRPALVEHARKRYPAIAERFRRAFGYVLGAYGCSDPDMFDADLSGFAVSLWAGLSSPTDEGIVEAAVSDLLRLVQARALVGIARTGVAGFAGNDASAGALRNRLRNLLDTAQRLAAEAGDGGATPDPEADGRLEEIERIASLFLHRVATGELERRKPVDLLSLGEIERESSLLMEMAQGVPAKVYEEMIELGEEFPTPAAREHLDLLAPPDRAAIDARVLRPQREVLWWFIRLLYRRLFRDEHYLSPRDAQQLGLINEVFGGSGRIPSPNEATLMAAAKSARKPGGEEVDGEAS